jgi:AcrR family transcriptional regulator
MLAPMNAAPARSMGLRERKRTRTRQTIVRVALELFTEHGYQATTLAQIAEAAEVAPSTLHAYFPAKEDIIFVAHAAMYESIRHRIIDRPAGETFGVAVSAWVATGLPDLVAADAAYVLKRRAIIDHDDDLLAGERLRLALIEDLLARAVASDFDESPTDLRSRLLASVATHGLMAVYQWWYPQIDDKDYDRHELSELYGTYLVGLLDAAQTALENLPTPSPHGVGRTRKRSARTR